MKRIVLALLLLTLPASAQEWRRDQRHCETIIASANAGKLGRASPKQIVQLSCGLEDAAENYAGTPAAEACLSAIDALKRLYVQKGATRNVSRDCH
jgi:hypothetical protein